MTIEGEVYVVEEGVSREGLRRVHLLRAGGEVDVEEEMRRVTEEDGRCEGWWKWTDEAGMGHLYMIWRWRMVGYPMYVVSVEGKLEGERLSQAIGRAAEGYFRWHGVMPNRAVLRGNGEPVETMEIKDGKGEATATVRVERARGMRAGDVGVWWVEEEKNKRVTANFANEREKDGGKIEVESG